MAKLKTYVVTYHMNARARQRSARPAANPEAAADSMKQWMAWAKRCGKKLVDFGAPLGRSVKLSASGTQPSRRNMAGYSILKAESMSAAKKLMKNHPHLGWSGGCDIEIHEAAPMPKM